MFGWFWNWYKKIKIFGLEKGQCHNCGEDFYEWNLHNCEELYRTFCTICYEKICKEKK